MINHRIYAIVQLVILVFYLLRPVIPFVEYCVNKKYIIKNLCINRAKPFSCCEGKCYLKQQLKKSLETDENKSKNAKQTVHFKEIKEFIKSYIAVPKAVESKAFLVFIGEEKVCSPSLQRIFIPPKKNLHI